jgi:2-dehydropantoate 2-reductase
MHAVIYGSGAVGAVIGAKLALSGVDVTFIARGAHLKALQENGLTYITQKGEQQITNARFISEADDCPKADYLFLCVKAYDLPSIAQHVPRFAGQHTTIVSVQNGVPWWHFLASGNLDGFVPPSLDPNGALQKHIPLAQVLGGVIYMAGSITAPGVAQNLFSATFKVGEPDRSLSPRLNTLVEMLETARFKAPLAQDIYQEIWLKLCWNVAFNPLSVLAELSSGGIAENPEWRKQAATIMEELGQLAKAIGIAISFNIEERLSIGTQAGKHKPSMLQDYEAGKRLESAAIIGSVVEIAKHAGCATPTINETYEKLIKKAGNTLIS